MPDLYGVSRADLRKAEAACECLLKLHDEHQALDGELTAGLGTLLASVRMIQQDRARKRLKQAAEQADPARAARMMAHAGAQLASMPQASAANAVLSARFLAAAVGDPAIGLTDEQVNMVVHLAVELVRGTPRPSRRSR